MANLFQGQSQCQSYAGSGTCVVDHMIAGKWNYRSDVAGWGMDAASYTIQTQIFNLIGPDLIVRMKAKGYSPVF